MARLLLVCGHKERVRGSAGVNRSVDTREDISSSSVTVGTMILDDEERLRGKFLIYSIRKVNVVVTTGTTL